MKSHITEIGSIKPPQQSDQTTPQQYHHQQQQRMSHMMEPSPYHLPEIVKPLPIISHCITQPTGINNEILDHYYQDTFNSDEAYNNHVLKPLTAVQQNFQNINISSETYTDLSNTNQNNSNYEIIKKIDIGSDDVGGVTGGDQMNNNQIKSNQHIPNSNIVPNQQICSNSSENEYLINIKEDVINENTLDMPLFNNVNINNKDILINNDNNKRQIPNENRIIKRFKGGETHSNVNQICKNIVNNNVKTQQTVIPTSNFDNISDDFENLIRANEIINKKHVSFIQNESKSSNEDTKIAKKKVKSKIYSFKSKNSIMKPKGKKNNGKLTDPLNYYQDEKASIPLTSLANAAKVGITPNDANKKSKQNNLVLKIPNYYSSLLDPQRPIVSSIDLAVQRRKKAREMMSQRQNKMKNNQDNSSSDYDDDGDNKTKIVHATNNYDNIKSKLWMMSGPQLKLDKQTDKLHFLQLFNLTTINKKNDYDLQLLHKNEWSTKFSLSEYSEEKQSFELPIPVKHPETLNTSPDFPEKSSFLRELGLRKITSLYRDEMEAIWRTIINDRLKRGYYSSLTPYFVKTIEIQKDLWDIGKAKQQKSIKYRNRYQNKQDHNHYRWINHHDNNTPKTVLRIPAVHLNSVKKMENIEPIIPIQPNLGYNASSFINNPVINHVIKVENKIEDGYQNQTLLNYPLAYPNELQQWQQNPIIETKYKFKWPGLEQILESYQEYSKEREIQIQMEKNKSQQLCDEIKNYQMQIEYLDRRLQYLQNIHCLQQDNQRTLENTKEMYQKFIDACR